MASFSMTYCWNARHFHRRCRLEQIALLITAFLIYAEGIRNSASQQSAEHVAINEDGGNIAVDIPILEEREVTQYNLPINYDEGRHITPPSMPSSARNNEAERYSGFRPSQQILDFTLSDVTTKTTQNELSQNYGQYGREKAENRQQSSVNQRYNHQKYKNKSKYNDDAQFSFPTENSNADAHSDGNDFKGINIVGAATVPLAHLPTIPILSYHDPYNYPTHLASLSSGNHQHQDNDIIYTASGQQGIPNHQHEEEPQSYTVQSTLKVGNNANNRGHGDSDGNGNGESIHHGSDAYRPLSSPNNEYKRPGYVFDEQIQPNHIRQQQEQQQRQHEEQFNADATEQKQQRLSYDSHDYPPPSYYQRPTHHHPQQHHQQQEYQKQKQQQQKTQRHQQKYSTYFDAPQRQDIGPNSISQPTEQYNVDYINAASTPTPSTNSNYANNFGNYLLTDGNQQDYAQHYQPHQYQKHHQYQQQEPPYTLNYKPSYAVGSNYPNQRQQLQHPSAYRPEVQPSNYYDYQLGEIPRPRPPHSPQHNYYPNYGVQRPTEPPSGLASLASLFTTTQQYAPQFTNLLLGALTGNGGSPAIGATSQQKRPINTQMIRALENIARNDDLQCVPKVLCQTIAGQTQRGQLPSFITSPAITNFLAGFPAASPALIYGRAALIGISGGEQSCSQTYSQCPKSEYEILHYLNNHRGGFFKFFSEPEEQPQVGTYDDNNANGAAEQASSTSLLSILSALAGNPMATRRPPTRTTTTTQRPFGAGFDAAGGIGNFFTQMISEYLSGVEHQRRRRSLDTIETESNVSKKAETIIRDEDFHDDEDNDDTEDAFQFDDKQQYDDIEARIINTEERDGTKFFPEEHNFKKTLKKLKFFPNSNMDHRDHPTSTAIATRWVSFSDDNVRDETTPDTLNTNYETSTATTSSNRRGKKMQFENDKEKRVTTNILFPDHYEQNIRKGRILNRPKYAESYTHHYENEDRFVLSNKHRKPHYEDFEDGNRLNELSSPSSHLYTRGGLQSNSLNRYSSTQGSGFRPTPLSDTTSSASNYNYNKNYYNNKDKSYNYPNNNYVSNNHRYSSNYQRQKVASRPTTRRPRHEDDPNVYVTNRNGVTEYYITPEGRKIYL